MVTATVVPVTADAARKATQSLVKAATQNGAIFAGENPSSFTWDSGAVVMKEGGRRATIAEILKSARLASVEGEAKTIESEEREKYSFRSFGAHCVEVRWNPGIAKLHVARVVSAFDTGRIINRKGAENQIHGSIVMGLGMALLEESVYDPRTGRVVTDNIADYLMPVNADLPELDITLLDEPDPHIGEFGAKGMGEVGITGIAAAIVNAVYHATGKRVRDLPVRIEKLLG
jgi:xanthine dehydrogenase YagR molybdenum-binding subunit